MLSTDSYSNILYLNPKQDTAKGFLFGLQILFLPDFLLDHTLLGKEPLERIQEYCRRWTQFVSGLWRSSGDVTYALRFDLNQTHKRIDSYILGRLRTPKSFQGENQANILLTDLRRMLASFGFEPEVLNQAQLQELSENLITTIVLKFARKKLKLLSDKILRLRVILKILLLRRNFRFPKS